MEITIYQPVSKSYIITPAGVSDHSTNCPDGYYQDPGGREGVCRPLRRPAIPVCPNGGFRNPSGGYQCYPPRQPRPTPSCSACGIALGGEDDVVVIWDPIEGNLPINLYTKPSA